MEYDIFRANCYPVVPAPDSRPTLFSIYESEATLTYHVMEYDIFRTKQYAVVPVTDRPTDAVVFIRIGSHY